MMPYSSILVISLQMSLLVSYWLTAVWGLRTFEFILADPFSDIVRDRSFPWMTAVYFFMLTLMIILGTCALVIAHV